MFKIFRFGFLLLFANMAMAQIPTGFKVLKETASFKKSMITESQKISTTESDFTQEKYLSVLSEKIVSKGHFYFRKENELRWEYLTPFEYLIVLSKGKMFIKNGGKVSKYNMNSNKMFKGINDMMMSVVKGDLFANPDYEVKYYASASKYLLVLNPVNSTTKQYLQAIQLTISKNNFAVEQVKMVEPEGDYTSIKFTNRKNNKPISDAKFKV